MNAAARAAGVVIAGSIARDGGLAPAAADARAGRSRNFACERRGNLSVAAAYPSPFRISVPRSSVAPIGSAHGRAFPKLMVSARPSPFGLDTVSVIGCTLVEVRKRGLVIPDHHGDGAAKKSCRPVGGIGLIMLSARRHLFTPRRSHGR